jgi:hypothetical protein
MDVVGAALPQVQSAKSYLGSGSAAPTRPRLGVPSSMVADEFDEFFGGETDSGGEGGGGQGGGQGGSGGGRGGGGGSGDGSGSGSGSESGSESGSGEDGEDGSELGSIFGMVRLPLRPPCAFPGPCPRRWLVALGSSPVRPCPGPDPCPYPCLFPCRQVRPAYRILSPGKFQSANGVPADATKADYGGLSQVGVAASDEADRGHEDPCRCSSVLECS